MGYKWCQRYRNERTNVSISKLIIGTKAKRFDLVCLISERKQNILIWYIKYCIGSRSFSFWPKNSGMKQSNLIWSGNCPRQSRTFLFNPKTNRSKQNILNWSAYYRNESKTFWFDPLIIGKKAKQFDLLGKLSQQKWLPASVSRGVGITEFPSRIFRRSDDFLVNFCEKSWVVGVHIVLFVGVPADVSVAVG